MTGSSTPSAERSPSKPRTLPERTLRYLDRLLVLALVPLATSLGNVGKLLATARADGLSVTASFPVYRYDLWSFVNAPDGGGVPVPVPFEPLGSVWLAVPLLAIYVVVSGVLSAGYFGSIAAAITTGSFGFVAGVRRFAVRMVALEALVVVGLLAVFLPLLVVPPLFVIAILALLLAGYFLFPTVYVLVLEDRGRVRCPTRVRARRRPATALVFRLGRRRDAGLLDPVELSGLLRPRRRRRGGGRCGAARARVQRRDRAEGRRHGRDRDGTMNGSARGQLYRYDRVRVTGRDSRRRRRALRR
jgi:hypothetical protein